MRKGKNKFPKATNISEGSTSSDSDWSWTNWPYWVWEKTSNIWLQGPCAAAGLELHPKAPKTRLGSSLLAGICRYWAGACLTPCYQFPVNSSACPFVPEAGLLSGLALLCLCPVCRQTMTIQYLALCVCVCFVCLVQKSSTEHSVFNCSRRIKCSLFRGLYSITPLSNAWKISVFWKVHQKQLKRQFISVEIQTLGKKMPFLCRYSGANSGNRIFGDSILIIKICLLNCSWVTHIFIVLLVLKHCTHANPCCCYTDYCNSQSMRI